MRIVFVDNDGGGFTERPEVADGTTIATFFTDVMGQDALPHKYIIKVQRRAGDSHVPVKDVDTGYIIQDGDRVSFSPPKQVGGAPKREKGRVLSLLVNWLIHRLLVIYWPGEREHKHWATKEKTFERQLQSGVVSGTIRNYAIGAYPKAYAVAIKKAYCHVVEPTVVALPAEPPQEWFASLFGPQERKSRNR